MSTAEAVRLTEVVRGSMSELRRSKGLTEQESAIAEALSVLAAVVGSLAMERPS